MKQEQKYKDGMESTFNNMIENEKLTIAFIQGAKFWEYYESGFTMWQSDQKIVEKEAKKRLKNKKLGVIPEQTTI